MTRAYSSLLVWLGLTIIASLALFHTSDRVNQLDQQLRDLNAQIESKQQSIHVLKAEWVYLSNPARIEAEVKGHLNLQPTAPRHVAALHDIADLLPVHNDIEPVQAIETAEEAPVHVHHQTTTSIAQASQQPHTHYDRVIASLNAGRINDHMIIQHSAPLQASTDSIGTLIGSLGLQP